MLAIDHVLVSDEIIEEKFVCDLSRCRGGCCVEGDGGAPLTAEETRTLEEIYDRVAPYLSRESVSEIHKQGKFVPDAESGWATPLINGGICVYGIVEDGIVKCGIEKAYNAGKIVPYQNHDHNCQRRHDQRLEGPEDQPDDEKSDDERHDKIEVPVSYQQGRNIPVQVRCEGYEHQQACKVEQYFLGRRIARYALVHLCLPMKKPCRGLYVPP